jgi:predicted ATPase with chaperone activity
VSVARTLAALDRRQRIGKTQVREALEFRREIPALTGEQVL